MPEGVEYLHCVQAVLDGEGLRYQVLDVDGAVRERLEWPLRTTTLSPWRQLPHGEMAALFSGQSKSGNLVELRLKGKTNVEKVAPAQTLFSAFSSGTLEALWLGLRGVEQTLTLIVGRDPGRSPIYWFGPNLPAGHDFDIHVAFCPDMGPGGVLFRHHDDVNWSSLNGATATGLERLTWPSRWSVGRGQGGRDDRPYCGTSLRASIALPASQQPLDAGTKIGQAVR